MASSSQKLIKTAKKYITIKELFPQSKIDLRKELSPYQKRKINKAYKDVEASGGAYSYEIVPMGRGRKKYMVENGLPLYQRGIFLPGGEKMNTEVKYTVGEVQYKRGNAPRSRRELETRFTENELISSAEKILKKRNHRTSSITANGRVIGSAQGFRDNATIIKEAAFIFNKYVDMAHNNEVRHSIDPRTGLERNTAAAHPNLWGMGILFEKAAKKKGKKNVKKITRKK